VQFYVNQFNCRPLQAAGIFENIKEKAKNGLAVTKRNFL
jgi:hypothetical protein